MPLSFQCALPRQIVFGAGTRRRLGAIAGTFGRRALLVTGGRSLRDSGRLDELRRLLTDAGLTVVHQAITGEPTTDTVDTIVGAHAAARIDVVVAVGGGSAIDAGKAVAAMLTVRQPVAGYLEKVGPARHPGTTLPLVVVPTTAGTGSEATKNAVLTVPGPDGVKASLRHDNFVPACALVDPELHLSCPAAVTAACGMDALTQLLEAYVSTQATSLSDAVAWSGLEHASSALVPAATDRSQDVEVRSSMAYAALLSGIALAQAGLGVVHGVAPVLGTVASVPHGVACGTLLAAATEATVRKLRASPGAPHPALARYAAAGRLLSGTTTRDPGKACAALVTTLRQWTERLGIPTLGDHGIRPADCARIAEASRNRNNPAELAIDEIAAVLSARIG